MHEHRAQPGDVLSSPVEWARIDYQTFTEPRLRGSRVFRVERGGRAHGLLIWKETALATEVGYSDAPGAREGEYCQMLLPWPDAVSVEPADTVEVEVRADPVGADYVWTWNSRVRRSNREIASFHQSTFFSNPVSSAFLHKRAGDCVPTLSYEGELLLDVLESMRADKSVRLIAEELLRRRPGQFRSLDEAHGLVGEISERYGR